MTPIRVLIVDDHPLFRDGIKGLLDSIADTQVIGEATDGAEAIARAIDLQPDVILMDINMPRMNGVQATREILQQRPDTGILIISMLEDDDSVFAAMRAGARGIS
jgi:DNA-binding NarL/FixJ family response regulator